MNGEPDFDPDFDLKDIYSDATLERIDDAARLPARPGALASDGVPTRRVPSGLRGGLAGAALTTALMTGVRDLLEPENEVAYEEVDDGVVGGPDAFVTLFFVPNDPWATRAVVRPWLNPNAAPVSSRAGLSGTGLSGTGPSRAGTSRAGTA